MDHFQGIPIEVEHPKGSLRSYGPPDANLKREMKADYGSFPGTRGADGDPVDFYLGDHRESTQVFVVNQRRRLNRRKFDEHKVILGCWTEADAKALYMAHYGDLGEQLFGTIRAWTLTRLRRFLGNAAASAKPARKSFTFAKASNPPKGYSAIPDGKRGGYRKRTGGKWLYWYPDGAGGGTNPTAQKVKRSKPGQHRPQKAPAGSTPIPPFASSRAKKGTGVAALEGGGFLRSPETGDKPAVTYVDDITKMKVLQEFEGLVVNESRAAAKRFGLKTTPEIRADLSQAAMEGLLKAIDSYKGTAPFAMVAKSYIQNSTRLHAATELGGVYLNKRQKRMVAGFQAARIQARGTANAKPSAAQIAEAWDLQLRHVHDTTDKSPVPMESYTYGSGNNATQNAGKIERVREMEALISGSQPTGGDELLVTMSSDSLDRGMSKRDLRDLRQDITKVLPKLQGLEITLQAGNKTTTYRADAAKLVVTALGLGGGDAIESTRGLANAMSIETKTKDGWVAVGDRTKRKLIEPFLERAMDKLRGEFDGSTKQLEKVVDAVVPEAKAKPGPSVRDALRQEARSVTNGHVSSWRQTERRRLRKERSRTKEGSPERAAYDEAIRNVSKASGRTVATEIAARTSPLAREMRELSKKDIDIEVISDDKDHGWAVATVDGERMRVRTSPIKNLDEGEQMSLFKAQRYSTSALHMARAFPKVTALLFADNAVLTDGRLAALRMAGLVDKK